MKRYAIIIFILATHVFAQAQIGYQISILDNSTGEPRVNEKVSVDIDITDSTDKVIHHSVKSGTTDQFGVLSLTIGDAETFSQVDWSQLPLYISAKLDGVLIGKSQILSVPVAEYAKKTGVLTMEKLCSKEWVFEYYGENNYHFLSKCVFSPDGEVTKTYWRDTGHGYDVETDTQTYQFVIEGNLIYLLSLYADDTDPLTGNMKRLAGILYYNPTTEQLYRSLF